SCFPKDVRALINVAESNDMDARILKSVDTVNDAQKEVLFAKLNEHFNGDCSEKVVAVWGLSFKPGTDDIREAPSLVLIERLLKANATVRVHDPVALENVRKLFGDKLTYCEHHYDALENADVLAIVTEWSEFRNPDFEYLKHQMKHPVIFDGRNLYDPQKMHELAIKYYGIGLHSNG
ncbi:MAG: UDP-glucose/GDP-mannose dehydrogenase family protein, partial [Planctomycetes bacterium]|nr:UDP-glucose/GDP-mannose dehydrogenase family protein [Planctomycetota bacterium]